MQLIRPLPFIFLFSALIFQFSLIASQDAITCFEMSLRRPSVINLTVGSANKSCIEIVDIPVQYKFFLIQAHSQKKNITLSETNPITDKNYVTGNGVGLVSVFKQLRTTKYWITNENTQAIDTRVALILYSSKAPVPGGCNMEFPVEISPFLRLRHQSGYTILEFQHAFMDYSPGIEPPSCSVSMNYLSYNIYIYFLEEMNYEENEYFRAIGLMGDVASIKKYGKMVYPFSMSPRTRVKFTSYPGQGVVYSVVAYYQSNNTIRESAYVPYVTYGCSFDAEVDGCGHLTGPLANAVTIVLAVIGLFVASRGHRFLTIEMAYFGFLVFALMSFILLVRFGGFSSKGDRDIFTLLLAFAGAILWAAVWWFFGIPVISVLLVGFVLGFLLTSVLYFTPIGNFDLLRNDFNYWMLMTCGMLAVPVFLLATTKFLNIVGSAIVGSYAVIVVIDRYIGTSLSYIVLNVVKRAVVDEFYLTTNEVPFQRNDILLSSAWLVLSVLMVSLQLYTERGRAPFPPAPFVERRRNSETRRERREARRQSTGRAVHFLDSSNERTPLLASNVAAVYSGPS